MAKVCFHTKAGKKVQFEAKHTNQKYGHPSKCRNTRVEQPQGIGANTGRGTTGVTATYNRMNNPNSRRYLELLWAQRA